ncbi:hypothetical protein G8E10_24785 [Rhizobiaceae bacterium CRRU44]|uniref:CobQ/CobB/MinD/ParA nucleotide binding domain-containing protein n=1 Tax=Ferranicluibacter rubi TaxID=2715133 RepID=A0AA44CDH5_9HYPH|nr:hypothetical protein [Ferranicluibacter rubi]NHT78919.1 hypothetical protein [Ferranicluibacter rubi]
MAAPKATSTPKKILALITNNKGGVGKSVIARVMADVFRGANKSAQFYDTDGGTGSLLLSYGSRDSNGSLLKDQDPANGGIGWFDIRSDKDRAKLLDNLSSNAPVIVCDMAGGSLAEISRIVDDGDGFDGFIDAVEAQGYGLVIINVVSNVQGATTSVRDYMGAFGGRAQQIVVVNKAWGKDESDFPFWYGFTNSEGQQKGGKTRADFLAAGGVEVHFPALQSGTFAKVDALQVPFSAAADNPDLSITERAHLSKFMKAAREAFLEIKDKIGL